jgi:hypothetical protein
MDYNNASSYINIILDIIPYYETGIFFNASLTAVSLE